MDDFPRMLRSGHLIALCVIALLSLGVLMVNSAGMSVDPREAVTVESILLSRSSAYMLGALVAMGLCAMLPIRRLVPARLRTPDPAIPLELDLGPRPTSLSDRARAVVGAWAHLAPMWALIGALLAFLALVYVPGIGKEVNGSHRWLRLPVPGLESFQPSEIAKWGLIGILALYGARYAGRMHRFWVGLLPALAAAGAVAAFIVKEDLGTGVLVGLVAALMLIAAGARVWHLAILAPLPLLGVAAAIATSSYRRERLLAFVDPYQHPQTIGYHMIQSMVAVANGQVSGRGLGHGLQKFGFLPEDKTDFLFAIICEELGVAGCVVVLALFGALVWTSLSVVRNERWRVLQLAGLGIVITVGVQAVINLFVVTGLGPTKGIALPLLSSGGTGWILTAASLGLLIAMDRTQHQAQAAELSPTDLIDRARREREQADTAKRLRAERAGKHASAKNAGSTDSSSSGASPLQAATATVHTPDAGASTSALLDDRHLGDWRFAPKPPPIEAFRVDHPSAEPINAAPGHAEYAAETDDTDTTDAAFEREEAPSATVAHTTVAESAAPEGREMFEDDHRTDPIALEDEPVVLARKGTYFPQAHDVAEPVASAAELTTESQSGAPERPMPRHAESEAIIETRPTTTRAGSAESTSRVTILTSPGEQGWLFSASSLPVTQSKVTMLTPTENVRRTVGPAARANVVVTELGRRWNGGTDSQEPARVDESAQTPTVNPVSNPPESMPESR